MAGRQARSKPPATARENGAPPADASFPQVEAAATGEWVAPAELEAAPAPAGMAEASPSMAQFLEIKAANPGCLLWYRMGDFYELFFEDAVVASAALGIVLTKRGKHLGEDIPMCGVPIHRSDEYLQRLIRAGHRVAIAEQLEDPAEARKRGSKAVVRRDVVRLVTPGTLTEDALLDAKTRNYLTAIHRAGGGEKAGVLSPQARLALASIDISTGDFEVGEVAGAELPGELARLLPSEVVIADALFADAELRAAVERCGASATPVPAVYFDSLSGEVALKQKLNVAELGGFGGFSRPELAAIAAALKYVELTQFAGAPVLRPPKRSGADAILAIDPASRASLELLRSVSGDRQGSLLAAIDRTVTGAGARELAARLASPLRDVARIDARLDGVGFLIDGEALRARLREALRAAPDLARAVTRLGFGRGGPRDLAAVRDALATARGCAAMLAGVDMGLPDDLGRIAGELAADEASLGESLQAALIEAPPHLKRDGGFIRAGYRAELDEARRLKEDSRSVMAALEAKYVERTGVKSLKVRHNNILGFYIEVTQLNAKPLLEAPLADEFRHRQTMANAVRFTTAELTNVEGRIASATERALSLELEAFDALAAAVTRASPELSRIAAALADLDVTAALAELARHEGYVRPHIDAGQTFDIRGGRHPVVEQALQAAKAGAFIENDCVLGRADEAASAASGDEVADGRIWLVTGPNMAGKSTFLRQNALIAVMAQMGSYVPARSARIGAVDRVFSRVGASDDLARGRSTFMVEMVETAAILNQATDRSLVILDEMGRGTATFDGLSIAWATLEYLHEAVRSRTLFATHYHELTALARRLDGLAAVTIDVREWHDDIVFLHKVKPGAADRSYGIQVAKLAGLPEAVVLRAREVLAVLEKSDGRRGGRGGGALDELPLFAVSRSLPSAAAGPSPVEKALDELQPDDLSPRAALEALYRLKALRRQSQSER